MEQFIKWKLRTIFETECFLKLFLEVFRSNIRAITIQIGKYNWYLEICRKEIFVYLEEFQELYHLLQNGSIAMIWLFCFMNNVDFLVYLHFGLYHRFGILMVGEIGWNRKSFLALAMS